jgi:hypothetical protein
MVDEIRELEEQLRVVLKERDEADERATMNAYAAKDTDARLRRAEEALRDKEEIEAAARSLHSGLTCAQDPMDVEDRIERLGAALSPKTDAYFAGEESA